MTSPNGGELWPVGEVASILWESDGSCGDSVRIELRREEALLAGVLCDTIVDATENDGDYTWVSAAQCDAESTGYLVRVLDLYSEEYDDSDSTFTIRVTPCDLAVTFPNGGETLLIGGEVEITWQTAGSCGDSVMIELLRSGAACDTLVTSAPNTGAYIWTAAACTPQAGGFGSGDATANGDYTIRLTDLAANIADESDAAFSLALPCVITVTEPTADDSFCTGDEVAISWETEGGCGSDVGIELLHEGGSCMTIAAATENDGSHTWPAEQCGGDSAGYAIRVTELDGGTLGESEGTFRVHGPCGITVTSPQDGAILHIGDALEITWESSICCGNIVTITLWLEGSECRTIAGVTDNDGNHVWNVEQCGSEMLGYTLRVTDLESGNHAEVADIAIVPTSAFLICADGSGEFSTIQAAIDASVDDYTIYLCDGTYEGDGNHDLDYGGRAITVRSVSGDPGECVIACAGAPEVQRGFTFHTAEGSGSILTGLTITGGYGLPGAAVHCLNASPTISNCVLRDNIGAESGGAIYCYGSQAQFTNCTIEDNESPSIDGGGAYCSNAAPGFTNCAFTGNTAAGRGGGVACAHESAPAFTNCQFTANTSQAGGGLCCDGGSVELVGCLFDANVAPEGGGVGLLASAVAAMTNCQLTSNQGASGGGIFINASSVSLTGGSFTANRAWFGGGLMSKDADVDAQGCAFSGNAAQAVYVRGMEPVEDYWGGAVLCTGPTGPVPAASESGRSWSAIFDGCDFIANTTSGSGGAVAGFQATDVTFEECSFSGNGAFEYGGGFYFDQDCTPALTSCSMYDNTAVRGGGVYAAMGSDLTVVLCTLAGNQADDRGGGIYLAGGAEAELSDCTLDGNGAGDSGGAVYVTGPGWPILTAARVIISYGTGGGSVGCPEFTIPDFSCSNIYGNVGGDWIGCILGDEPPEFGNISADPMYCDREGRAFELQPGSPCEAACAEGHPDDAMGAHGVGCP